MAAHARVLDRRRFEHRHAGGPRDAVLRALDAHREEDGGMAMLEPDIRAPDSQPACALYALEILEEVDGGREPLTAGILDWLEGVTGPEGGVPFVLPSAAGWPHAPWFAPADGAPASLLMTAGLASIALRLGVEHPWLDGAVRFCWERLAAPEELDPYTLRYALRFLDAVADRARAEAVLDMLAGRVPPSGRLTVAAGTEGESLRPTDVITRPDHAAARLYPAGVLERDVDALAAEQHEDGGWTFTWAAWNPTAAWEWRGIVTLEALAVLEAFGRPIR